MTTGNDPVSVSLSVHTLDRSLVFFENIFCNQRILSAKYLCIFFALKFVDTILLFHLTAPSPLYISRDKIISISNRLICCYILKVNKTTFKVYNLIKLENIFVC